MLSLLLFIVHSYAVPYCEQFDDEKAYNECVLSGKHDTVPLKPEDVDTDEEEACKKKGDSKEMNNCLVRSREKANQNARVREEKERAQRTIADKPAETEKPKCDAKTAKFQCEEAHKSFQSLRNNSHKVPISEINDASAQCELLCTRKTASVAAKFAGCTMKEIGDANTRMFALFATCNKPDSSSAVCEDYTSKEGAEKLETMKNGMLNGSYVGDQKTCSQLFCTTTKKLDGNISMVAETPNGMSPGTSSVYFTDSAGNKYTSYEQAQQAGMSSLGLGGSSDLLGASVPKRSSNAEAAIPGGTTTGGSSSGGSSSGGTGPRSTETPADTGGGNGTQVASNEKPTNNPQQQPASTNGGATSPAASTSGGATSPSNFSSNPFAGTGFTGGTGIEGTLKDNSFQALGDSSRRDSGSDSELSGANSGADYGGGYGSSGGSYNRSGARGVEAVGGNSSGGGSMGRSSLGGGNSGGNSGSSSGGRVAVASRSGDYSSPNFQSGYYKPSGSAGVAAVGKVSGKPVANGKLKKIKRKGQVVDCGGNLNCIAGYLGQGKTRKLKGGRGLASIGGASRNTEIGSGYGDIMSTMERIHNKFGIDEEGNLEVPK